MSDDLTARCRAVLLERYSVQSDGRSMCLVDVDDAAACMARAIEGAVEVRLELGIYPEAVVKHGIMTKRTPWQEGWNAACMEMLQRVYQQLVDAALVAARGEGPVCSHGVSLEVRCMACYPDEGEL